MVLDEQPAQIKLIAYFVYFFTSSLYGCIYRHLSGANSSANVRISFAYFYLLLSFCYCYMCSRKAVYLQWEMMRFAATVASVSARKKKHTTATHTHTAYIQTHLYLQSQNQMYLEGAPMATMWWRAFNYDFHKFSTKCNAIRTNTSLRREPPSS